MHNKFINVTSNDQLFSLSASDFSRRLPGALWSSARFLVAVQTSPMFFKDLSKALKSESKYFQTPSKLSKAIQSTGKLAKLFLSTPNCITIHCPQSRIASDVTIRATAEKVMSKIGGHVCSSLPAIFPNFSRVYDAKRSTIYLSPQMGFIGFQ